MDHEADRTVTVTFKKPVCINVIREGYAAAEISKKNDSTLWVTVPAASFVIIEFWEMLGDYYEKRKEL